MAITINGTGSITGLTAGGLPDGSVTAADIASGVIPDAISVARITDSKASGTSGGTFTSGMWRTRDLNTIEEDPDSIVTLASNQFTLGAGTYLIQWNAPAFQVHRHMSKLFDVTNTTDLALGSSEYNGTSSDNVLRSFGFDIVTLAANNTFEIRHRCQISVANNGLGVETNFAAEKYTMVTIFKLS
jgi:hypothetical protein